MLAEQNIQALHRLRDIIDQLDDREYTATHIPYYSSSIGAHARHILDHYLMLVAGLEPGIVDYDRRGRDPEIETCRDHARATIDRICEQLQQLPADSTPVQAALSVSLDRDTPAQISTVGRELTFLCSHTVHHQSMIALIMRLQDKPVAGDIGYAPSTLKHRSEVACAP